MRTYAAVIAVALTLVTPRLDAQQVTDLKQVLYRMANNLGMLRTLKELDSLMTVEFWATGTVREVGPKTVGPPVQLKSYYGAAGVRLPRHARGHRPAPRVRRRAKFRLSAARSRGTRISPAPDSIPGPARPFQRWTP